MKLPASPTKTVELAGSDISHPDKKITLLV